MTNNRKAFILNQLKKKGEVSVAELCSELEVSDMTIRRDLAKMEQEGLLRRVHGGAILEMGRSYERNFFMRNNHLTLYGAKT